MKKRLFSLILMIVLCMANTLLFSALAFEGSTKTEVVNGIFLTTPTNVPAGSNIIFSAYKNNKMVYTDVYSYKNESVIPFYIKNNAEYDSAKIMVWDDNLRPLTQVESFGIPEETPEVEVEQNVKELENVQLICTDEISIDASLQPAASDMLRFKDANGNTYDLSAYNIYMHYNSLGRYGTIRYRINSDNSMELVSFTVSGTESEISVKKIKSVSDDKIEYYIDDKYSDYSAVTVNNPTVIYNNRALKNSSDFVALLKKDASLVADANDAPLNSFGTIKFVDDTAGDLLIINTYKSYYMSKDVDSKNYLVTLDGRADKVYMPINDTENYEILKKTSLIAEGTTPASLTIPTKSIVTLSMSCDNSIGTKYIEYLINYSEKSGTPTEITALNGPDKMIVKIGNETYRVVNDKAASQFEVGTSLTYLTDASGAIVYVTSVSSGNKRFGYYAAYVSGDVNEDDSVKIKFYDPESKEYFTVTISDSENDVMLVANYKSSGKLFWMNITNGKVKKGDIKFAENVTTADDENLAADVVYDRGTTIYKSGSQYTLTGANNTNYSSTYGAVFVRPDNMSEKNEFTYSNYEMLTGSSTKYANPEVYQIKRADRTYVFVMIDKFKGLQQTSNVYVVNEIGNNLRIGDNNVTKVSYYDFKTGAKSRDGKELVFLTSVLESLDLKKGDIFTYYNDSEINGVDFDKASNIFILLRAEELSADKTKAAYLQDSLTYEMNASKYQNGFRKFGIYQSNIESTYYNATLQVPVYTDTNEENNVMLYLGRSNVKSGSSNIDRLEEIVTFVPGETIIADEIAEMFPADAEPLGWTPSNIIDSLGKHVTGVKATTSTKLFVYDPYANESERLIVYQRPTIDDLHIELGNIINVEMLEHSDAETVAANLENCALTYTYFTNYSQTLNSIFIIK